MSSRTPLAKSFGSSTPRLKTQDPRRIGKGLKGSPSDYWRYRVGDYRVLCHLRDRVLTVLVVEIGHRSKVYR